MLSEGVVEEIGVPVEALAKIREGTWMARIVRIGRLRLPDKNILPILPILSIHVSFLLASRAGDDMDKARVAIGFAKKKFSSSTHDRTGS